MADGAALHAELVIARDDLQIDVVLDCPPGITCVMGPSGAGKSSVLGAIAGLVAPVRGRVALGGDTWLDTARGVDVPVHARRLAYVLQGLALFPHMTVQRNVEYALADLPGPRAARARELLERCGAAALADRRPRTLSGGEAQRVALARALARRPQLILLDEPFSALDRALRTQLAELVKSLAHELAVPLVHVTHSDAEAELLADGGGRIVRMERGRIAG